MKMKKYRKAFLPNPNFRFSVEPIQRIAKELVYVCPAPMFDDMAPLENARHFEGSIVRSLEAFDPEQDIVVFFGDALIFGLMIYHLAGTQSAIKLARYSSKRDEYIVRECLEETFEEMEMMDA
jgi:hypothetical protein